MTSGNNAITANEHSDHAGSVSTFETLNGPRYVPDCACGWTVTGPAFPEFCDAEHAYRLHAAEAVSRG